MVQFSNNCADDKKNGRKFYRRRGFYVFLLGVAFGIAFVVSLHQTSVHFSSNQSCMSCHVHPHAEASWRLSSHANNSSGVVVNCVDCHLPPPDDTWAHYVAKLSLGARDVWGYLTKDSADFDWDKKSEVEYATRYISNASCIKCHQNLYPQGISDAGIKAHLHYDENHKKQDIQCIHCHLDVGHYNPRYLHGQLTDLPTDAAATDSVLFFKEPTSVSTFQNYTEQIPGTAISFRMIAIKGGSFEMGSLPGEPFHKADEWPRHEVMVSSFFMAEVETSWDQYWQFYAGTLSEGRMLPEEVYANNLKALEVDAVSGPTPPFGYPDQGWGMGSRPAITLTHYAAQTFCRWLSLKTGKKYRLPTEAEWEYAARGGTQTAYFFEGNPRDFAAGGLLRKVFPPQKDAITPFVVYAENSRGRTQEPEKMLPNPFGLKNMLGNVWEYCADKYDAEAYAKRNGKTQNPLVTTGEEYVVRGGNYASDAADVRCAARSHTRHNDWLKTDPQQPKSIWWYSDFKGIGFRVVCEPDSALLSN